MAINSLHLAQATALVPVHGIDQEGNADSGRIVGSSRIKSAVGIYDLQLKGLDFQFGGVEEAQLLDSGQQSMPASTYRRQGRTCPKT